MVDLLITKLFSLLVLFFKLGQFLSQICKSLCCILHLLEHIRLTLVNEIVQLLLSSQLIDFKLPLQLLLLLDLFLGRLQISLQVEQEIGLLNHLKSFLELIVLFHKVYNGFISVLNLTFSDADATSFDGACAS